MSGEPEFPSHLRVKRQLGRGAYGTVHLCEDVRDGAQVAVKHVRHAARHGKSILREVRLLARLKHDNLLHLLDFPAVTGPDFEDVFLVLPYFPADLHKVIQSRQTLSNKHVQVIICQILRALTYLHASGVAHRDLKPANILLSSDCRLKVCDFGLARGDMPTQEDDGEEEEQACGVLTEYVVTRWYRAPEVMLLPKHYTSTVDLWSIGCILGEICGRKPLFPGKNHVDMIVRVAHVLGTPSDDELNWLPKKTEAYRFVRRVCPRSEGVPLSTLYPQATSACLDLLRGLLGWDPARRLTADEAQDHEYLRSYLPKEKPVPPEPFDWSFDGFRPTASAVKERLYRECCLFHPEMLDREASALANKLATAQSRNREESGCSQAALPPRPPKGTTPPVPAWARGDYPQQQQQQKPRQLSAGCPPGPPASRMETPPQSTSSADYPQTRANYPQQQKQRQLPAGYPAGPPASRMETPPQSTRSSPGCGYGVRTSSARYPGEVASCRSSPQAAYIAPSRSSIPQPHFHGRSAHVAHTGRSVTPPRRSVTPPQPRVLAR